MVCSVSDTKKVFFANGNLYCTFNGTDFGTNTASNITFWDFESEQYYIRHNTTYRSHIFCCPNSPTSTGVAGTMGYFYPSELSNAVATLSANEITNKNTTFTNSSENHQLANPDFTVKGVARIWRCLIKDEWECLLKERETVCDNNYKFVSITTSSFGKVRGLIIFPDNYSGDTTEITEIPDGRVFLSSAGYECPVLDPHYSSVILYAASNKTYDRLYSCMQYADETGPEYLQNYYICCALQARI